MAVNEVQKLGSSSRVEVSWAEGILRLRDADLFGQAPGDRIICFLYHVFTLSEVAWVEVDHNVSTASIHYDAGRFELAEFLQRLAAALRDPRLPHADATSRFLERDLTRNTGRIKIRRFGAILTTWDIIHDRPGRIRLRHQTIHRNAVLADRLQGVIENIAGVIECAVWPVTGSVLIRFNPDDQRGLSSASTRPGAKYTFGDGADVPQPGAGRF